MSEGFVMAAVARKRPVFNNRGKCQNGIKLGREKEDDNDARNIL